LLFNIGKEIIIAEKEVLRIKQEPLDSFFKIQGNVKKNQLIV